MVSYSGLDALLKQFGGKHTNSIDCIAADYAADPPLLLHLVELAEQAEPPTQTAATALLKRYQMAGVTFPAEVGTRILDMLSSPRGWESTLQLLQMVPRLSIPAAQAERLCDSLLRLVKARNRFVRAWAYGGLHRLASLHASYREEVSQLLQRAGREEAASVRARLRQLPILDTAGASR